MLPQRPKDDVLPSSKVEVHPHAMASTHDIKLSMAINELKQPLYLKIRQILREQILNDFQHGQRFYTERELVKKMGISQGTIRRAVQALVDEGYLKTDPRKGFFVHRQEQKRYVGLIKPPGTKESEVDTAYVSVCRQHNFILNTYAFHKNETVQNIIGMIKHKPSQERILLMGLTTELTLELGNYLRSEGYQFVVANVRVPGLSGSSVSLDHDGEVEQVLDYLTKLGHERILFMVNEPRNLLLTSLRAGAVRNKLLERKLSQAQLVFCDTQNWESSFEAAYKKTHEIMQSKPAPTAIIPLSGIGAWAVLRYATENKIQVPQQLSIISFEPIVNTCFLPVPLTELAISFEEIAEKAVKILWSDRNSPTHEMVGANLVVRASTGPPPAK